MAGEGRSVMATVRATGIALVPARMPSGRAEAAVEHRRVDAAGEVPQLGQRVLGVLVGRADQVEGAVIAGRLLQVLLDLTQRHGQRGQPDLGPVVQVALDPAQPGGGLVDRAGAPSCSSRARSAAAAIRACASRSASAGRRVLRARRSRPAGSGRPPNRRAPMRSASTPPSPAAAPNRAPAGCAPWAGDQRAMATAEPSRQTTSPAIETGRGRYAARVYSRTRMATSALVGWRA